MTFFSKMVRSLVTFSLIGLSALAEKNIASKYLHFSELESPPVAAIQLTDAEKKQKETEAKFRSSRDAEKSLGRAKYTKKFSEMSTEWLAVKSESDIDRLVNRCDSDEFYNSLPVSDYDAKLICSQIALLKPFKGILYRLRPLFEESDAKVVHSVTLASTRQFMSAFGVFFPNQVSRAIENYFSRPMDNMAIINKNYLNSYIHPKIEATRIHNEGELSAYLRQEVYVSLAKMESRVNVIERSIGDQSFWFDNQLLYGNHTFLDRIDRDRRWGKAELNAILASANLSLAQLDVTLSYRLDDLLTTIKNVGRLYGVDAFWWDPDGVQAKERFAEIKKSDALFTRKPQATDHMRNALTHIQSGVEYAYYAKIELDKRDPSDRDVLDSTFVRNDTVSPRLTESIDKVREIVNGRKDAQGQYPRLRSKVSGKEVQVNFPWVFQNPPADLKIAFLPIEYRGGPSAIPFQVKLGKDSVVAVGRNYREGEPTKWNMDFYKNMFPGVTDSAGLKVAQRIFAQSYGGFLFVGPLSAVMF